MTKKMTHNYTQQVRKQSREIQGRGKTFRQSALTMLTNQTGQNTDGVRPFTDEKHRKNFDINANLNEINADLSSKGDGFVRIQQDTASRVGGFGTQANATSNSSKMAG